MNITPKVTKYAGYWSACPVDDGGATDTQLILLPSGGGVIAEFNWLLLYVNEIVWSFSDGVLTVQHTDEHKRRTIIDGNVILKENVEVEDITGNKKTFDCFQVADEKFYRLPLHDITHSATDEEIEHSLKNSINYLRKILTEDKRD